MNEKPDAVECIRFFNDEANEGRIERKPEDDGEKGAPASADILNSEAVDTFIEMTHDRYYEHLKEYFGNIIIAFLPMYQCTWKNAANIYCDAEIPFGIV